MIHQMSTTKFTVWFVGYLQQLKCRKIILLTLIWRSNLTNNISAQRDINPERSSEVVSEENLLLVGVVVIGYDLFTIGRAQGIFAIHLYFNDRDGQS